MYCCFCILNVDFKKEDLHRMAFIEHEFRRVVNNHMEFGQRFELLENKIVNCLSLQNSTAMESNSLNELDDCPLPIDNL